MCISGINTHPLVLSCFRWRGVGVKVLGPVAASELAPMSVARLLGYSLMDVKRTYLLTGMNEEALGIIRCAETHTAVHVCVCVWGGGLPRQGTYAHVVQHLHTSLTRTITRRYMRALEPFSAGDLRDEGLVLYSLGR